MAKLVLSDLGSLTNEQSALSTINNNNALIEAALENTLSRDGTSPNTLSADLDMNSNRITNLPLPASDLEPLRRGDITDVSTAPVYAAEAAASAAAAATSEANAATSETNAAASETNAATSETNAAASATNAATSATNAASSATSAANSVAAFNAQVYTTRTAFVASTPDGSVNAVTCMGYSAAGDCAPFTLKRQASRPYFGGVQAADGSWWLYVPPSAGIDARAFGVKADWAGDDAVATDDTTALQNCIYYATYYAGSGADVGGGEGARILLPKGTSMISSRLYVLDGINIHGQGVHTTVLKMKNTFSTTEHFIQLGTPGDNSAVAYAQSRASAGTLTLNGNRYQSAFSAAVFWFPIQVSVFSTGNDTGITFTIHGKDRYGATQSSTISGSNASSATTSQYFSTVDSVTTSGATAGNVSVGTIAIASFGCLLSNLQLFSGLNNASANTAMVYSNSAQHEAGLRGVKIFAGNRSATWFETGIGGASYFTFDGVETFNTGNQAGNASNNPQMYFNYAGLMHGVRNVLCGGPGVATAGASSVGIKIDGGFIHLQDVHTEGIGIGILDNITNANYGAITIQNYLAGAGLADAIKMNSGATATAHLYVSAIFPNGATNTINDARTATLTTGNIIDWTKK